MSASKSIKSDQQDQYSVVSKDELPRLFCTIWANKITRDRSCNVTYFYIGSELVASVWDRPGIEVHNETKGELLDVNRIESEGFLKTRTRPNQNGGRVFP